MIILVVFFLIIFFCAMLFGDSWPLAFAGVMFLLVLTGIILRIRESKKNTQYKNYNTITRNVPTVQKTVVPVKKEEVKPAPTYTPGSDAEKLAKLPVGVDALKYLPEEQLRISIPKIATMYGIAQVVLWNAILKAKKEMPKESVEDQKSWKDYYADDLDRDFDNGDLEIDDVDEDEREDYFDMDELDEYELEQMDEYDREEYCYEHGLDPDDYVDHDDYHDDYHSNQDYDSHDSWSLEGDEDA